jgi:hypothetical protein
MGNWLYDALFGEPQQARDKRETVRAVIDRNFQRAGVSMDEAGRNSLAESMIAGNWDSPEAREFESLVLLGQPDNYGSLDDATDISIYGKSPKELQAAMFDGYKGRGWSKSDIEARPPDQPAWMKAAPEGFEGPKNYEPLPREMSEGSRQAYEWDSDRELLGELKRLQKDKSVFATQALGVDAAVDRWKSKQNQKFGTSGWAGAMENPEYAFGHLNNHFLSPTANGIMYQSRGEREPGDDRGVLSRLMDKWDNEAETYTQMTDVTNRVSPPLPGNPQTWQEKEVEFKKLKQAAEAARPMSYDDHHKRSGMVEVNGEKTGGQYPSYLGSGAREFAENSADISTALSLGATGVGSAMAKHTAKQAALAAGKAMTREIVREELPMYAGLNVGITSHMKSQANEQAGEGFEPFNQGPGLFQSFLPGDQNRPDTWIRDPETNQFRPETSKEFNSRYDRQVQERNQAFQNWPKVQSQLPKHPLSGLTK